MTALPRILLACLLVAGTAWAFVPGTAQAQTAPPLAFVQPLSPGATQSVQERLREAGLYRGAADGVWGPESQAALDRFQQGRGLAVTGSLNQATAQALGVPLPQLLSVAPETPAAGLNPRAVRNVQQRLRALGYYRAAPDGIWGAGTQAALERFQRGRGLEATGQVNPATAQALGLDPNNLEGGGR
jgi:peptidoglycan hydrolase-like protein with peptidoglycan-binding domain